MVVERDHGRVDEGCFVEDDPWWQEFSVSVPRCQFSVGFSRSVLNGYSQLYTQMSHGVREIKMANSAEVFKKSYLKFRDEKVLP